MKEDEAKRLEVIREYLERKGIDPNLAPILLKESRGTRSRAWVRLVQIIFAAIGFYYVLRWILKFLIGA
jgi:hypothetical protein